MCGYIKRKDKPFRMNKVIQNPIQNEEIEQIEVDLLLEAIYRYYGYDFRNYAPAIYSEKNFTLCSQRKANEYFCTTGKDSS